MGAFDALATAVSGLQAQSIALQNISGNVANSQTIGFKSTDTTFQYFVNSSLTGSEVSGTVDALSNATVRIQGAIQNSTIATSMAISGDGYFTVEKPTSIGSNGQPTFAGSTPVYTRRGDFQPDGNGFLVNGAGYYLMGSPVDPATGNPTTGAPQLLQFKSSTSLAAQPTTQIQYSANLPSGGSPTGSGLLVPADFEANPISGAPQPAAMTGIGATLSSDANAVVTGSANISGLPAGGVAGALSINGTNINVAATDSAAGIVANINAQTGLTGVAASLNASNQLVLTGANATTNVTIGGNSAALLGELGLAFGTTNATNLLTQNAVAAGQTMTLQVGANPALTITFGTGPGQVQTLAQLNTALSSLAGGTASVNATNGNLSVTAANAADQITIGGTASALTFGVQNSIALPANGTVVGNDVTTFLNQSLSGGAVTGYNAAGTAVNVQLRWAKVDSTAQGGADTWNLFYQTNSSATRTQPAWQNVGTTFTFSPTGQMNPPITSLSIPGLTANGASLPNVTLNFGAGGITQFAGPNGVQILQLSQNGTPVGALQNLSINSKGLVEGTFSNGRTVDLAGIRLATFAGQDFLQQGDGETFIPTTRSGAAQFNASGQIVGSALEASNTDVADQFTTMIMTQQAYSATTKVVTTTDQMLLTLTNLTI
jgi:flagellar hook protein FlgE